MKIKSFFEKVTGTLTYIVIDEASKECAIIDSVLNYDPDAGRTSTISADEVIAYVKEQDLKVSWILETHIHADHLTASHYLKERLGGKTAMGKNIIEVLKFWLPMFNDLTTPKDGSQFDHLFENGEVFKVGSLEFKVIFTPGHTPACASYLVEDAVFVGDVIFMPYVGTARVDFPGGSAEDAYESIMKILSLPDNTRIFTGHEYPPQGQEPKYQSSVLEQKQNNILLKNNPSKEEFVNLRKARDKGKAVPHLLLPSIRVNIKAGQLPEPESNGISYIKIPLNKI